MVDCKLGIHTNKCRVLVAVKVVVLQYVLFLLTCQLELFDLFGSIILLIVKRKL